MRHMTTSQLQRHDYPIAGLEMGKDPSTADDLVLKTFDSLPICDTRLFLLSGFFGAFNNGTFVLLILMRNKMQHLF